MTRPIVWALGVFASVGIAATFAGDRLASVGLRRPPPEKPVAAAESRPAAPLAVPAKPVAARPDPRTETIVGDQRGHFAVDGRIDGTRIQLMVDTGASLVVLRQEDAERIGIQLSPYDFTGRTSTANGTGTFAPVMLRSLRIGNLEVRDIQAAVVPRGQLQVNLLGMSFLKRLRSFDIADNRITLRG